MACGLVVQYFPGFTRLCSSPSTEERRKPPKEVSKKREEKVTVKVTQELQLSLSIKPLCKEALADLPSASFVVSECSLFVRFQSQTQNSNEGLLCSVGRRSATVRDDPE